MTLLSEQLKNAMMQQDDSIEKILISLIDEKNIGMKTEVQNPTDLTKLKTFADILKKNDFKEESTLIYDFIKDFKINMVSFDRKSRKEIIDALRERITQERSFKDKLTGNKPEG